MKKLNNKGFLLSETLITTCIIATLATSLYIYISKLIDNYEKRDNYDNVVDVYKVNNYKIFFENYEKTNTNYSTWNLNYKPELNTCTSDILHDMDFLNAFSIGYPKMLYICRGSGFKSSLIEVLQAEIDGTTSKTWKTRYSEFQEYIRLLSTKDIEDNEYIILAMFNNSQGRKTSFASIETGVK